MRLFKNLMWAMVFMLLGSSSALTEEPTAVDQRLAVPDQAAREKSQAMVQEILGTRLSAAKTAPEFSALAAELSKLAADSGDDANTRFVLLQNVVDVATKAGDYRLAYAAAEEVTNDYQVDRFLVLPRVLTNLAPRASANNFFEARLYYLGLIAEANSAERYDVAAALCEQFAPLTQRFGDAVAKKDIAAKIAEVQALKKSFTQMTTASQALAANPNDPAANDTVGKYLLEKGKWEQAYPKLALSHDDNFKTLAAKATASLDTTAAQLELADQSWKLAEANKGMLQLRLQQLAGHYYSKAQPQTTGLEKAKIEIRLKELTKNVNAQLGPNGFAALAGDSTAINPNYAKRAELAMQDMNSTPLKPTDPGNKPLSPNQPGAGGQQGPMQPGAAPVIKIVSARWGGGSKWADITEKVQGFQAKDAGRWIWATTDMLKVDPTPGWRKKMEIHYEIDGKPYKAIINEGKTFKPAEIIKKAREPQP